MFLNNVKKNQKFWKKIVEPCSVEPFFLSKIECINVTEATSAAIFEHNQAYFQPHEVN